MPGTGSPSLGAMDIDWVRISRKARCVVPSHPKMDLVGGSI